MNINNYNIGALLYNNKFDASGTIGTIIRMNRTNDILNFLIVLTDDNYINKSIFGGKSLYNKLLSKKDLFYGNLEIKKFSEFTKNTDNISSKYLIEGNITPRIVYIKLPKENIYVSADTFQDKYLDSKINELISIFTNLHAEIINISIIHENASNLKLSLGSDVNINGVKANINASKTNDNNKKIETSRILTFQKPSDDTIIDTKIFTDCKKFHYLPKDEGWIDIIRQRVYKKAKNNKYVYNYLDKTCFSVDLSAQLQLLNINFAYNSNKYENLKIEYDVIYFPFTGNVKVPNEEEEEDEEEEEEEEEEEKKVVNNRSFNPIDLFNPFKWSIF